jgi:hypothetical protein
MISLDGCGIDGSKGVGGADDVSQVVLLLDVNPFFWGADAERSNGSVGLTFDQYFQHVSVFLT